MPTRVVPADDPERFLRTDLLVWADGRSADPTEQVLRGIAEHQRFAALSDEVEVDPTTYAGIYGVYDLELGIPGPRHEVSLVPTAGLTWVGVHPDARRRGVLTTMIRDHFARTAAAEASGLSLLHASEPTIYGRFGYGIASRRTVATVDIGTKLSAPGLEEAAARIATRLLTAGQGDAAARAYAASRHVARETLGAVVREQRTLEAFAHEGPEMLRDKEPMRVFLASESGQDVGYAWFRRKPKWSDDGRPEGEVEVELVGAPAAELALMRRVLDLDLMAKVKVSPRSREDVIRPWIGTARGTHGATFDGLWLRLVDLPKAMSARGYSGAGEVVLEVTDDFLPEQGGRWRLSAGEDGVGGVERTDATAEVALSTQQLASAYLGDGDLPHLHRAGMLTEHTPGSVARLEELLRMPVAPAGALGF